MVLAAQEGAPNSRRVIVRGQRVDAHDMQAKLRGYLNQLDWSSGATKDDIMGTITERDNDLRTMVDEYIAEGTYPSADEVLFLIPDQAWQSSQGDDWRGPEIQYVENVQTGFEQSPVGQDEHRQDEQHAHARSAGGKQTPGGGQQTSQGGQGDGHAQHGLPGDGVGRIEDPGTRHGGVWPASGPLPDDPDARYQGMASFGQGDRGAAGYQDSGQSEVFTVPPEGGNQRGNQGNAADTAGHPRRTGKAKTTGKSTRH